jgi:hypothetical protein
MTRLTPPPLRNDKLHRMLAVRAAPTVARVRDIRRSLIGAVPDGTPNRIIPGLTRTQFPSMVRDAALEETILKGGENISKIGGVVLVGPLKGARIVSLALEERATCPRSCAVWDYCYGNNMPRLQRYNPGPALEAKITMEIVSLCERHEKVLVRLHILGDFYSLAYLRHWARLLDRFPGLHVFGFTAWTEETPIGKAVAAMRDREPQRFAVRSSGRTGRWGSFTLPFPTDRPMIGDAAVCPEQRDAMAGAARGTHCGSCGLCWKTGGAATGRPIAFVEH